MELYYSGILSLLVESRGLHGSDAFWVLAVLKLSILITVLIRFSQKDILIGFKDSVFLATCTSKETDRFGAHSAWSDGPLLVASRQKLDRLGPI